MNTLFPSTFGHALNAVNERCRIVRLVRKGAEGPANQVNWQCVGS